MPTIGWWRARGRIVVALVALVAPAGCTPMVNPSGAPAGTGAPASGTNPPPTAAAPGIRGRDWGAAAVVEQPPGNPDATLTPYENPNSLGHPQHYQGGQADLLDVASSDRFLVAVGYLAKDFSAAMWWSTDGRVWALASDIDADEFSNASSVAIGPGAAVAVGASGQDAAAWRSEDGRTWQRVQSPAFHDAATQIRMTAVVARGDGFVAGGYAGGLVGPIAAAFWTSPDGLTWTRVTDGAGVADSRVTGLALATDGSRLVAVGVVGDGQHVTDAATWTSTDGTSWQRGADASSLRGALMYAVTAGDDQFLAVGSDARAVRAIAWQSRDGVAWEQAPDAVALDNFGLKVEMRDVTWTGDGFLAGGHYLFGTQYPSGALWTSEDGRTWERAPDAPALSQGKVQGVTSRRDLLFGVGSYGSPDFSIPTVWISPPS